MKTQTISMRPLVNDYRPLLDGKPIVWTRTQYDFIMTGAEQAWLAGAFGCGKTLALLQRGHRLSRSRPGGAGMIGTYKSPQFYRVVYPKLKELWNPLIVRERKRPIHQIWTKTEGETPFCWTLQSYGEPDKLGGDDLDIVLGDEMNLCSEDSHRALTPRLRRSKDANYLCYASNNKGKDWLWKMFVKNNMDNRLPNIWWRRTSTYENLHNLPANYLEKFKGFSKRWWQRNILGLFVEFEGAVYDVLSEKIHLIPQRLILPHYNISYSLDHGYDHPTVCVLWFTDEFDNTVAFDEYYMRGEDPVANAEAIVEFLKPYAKGYGNFPLTGWADPSMWHQHSGYDPMSDYVEIFDRAGVCPPLAAYRKDSPNHAVKVQGVYKVMARLTPRSDHKHIVTGQEPGPKLYFVRDKCMQTWESLCSLSWAKDNASGRESVAKQDGDDGADCTWYEIWNDPEKARNPDKKQPLPKVRQSLLDARRHRSQNRFCPARDFDEPEGVGPEELVGVGCHDPRNIYTPYMPER